MAQASHAAKHTSLHLQALDWDTNNSWHPRTCLKTTSPCAGVPFLHERKFATSFQHQNSAYLNLVPHKWQRHVPRATTSVGEKTASEPKKLDHAVLKQRRKFNHWTQPWGSRETVLRKEADGIWTLTQPFQLGFGRFADARLRATVVRLEDGSLWVYGPVALTEECRELVESLGGPVTHLVIPNTSPEHAWFSKSWAEGFPDARWYAPVQMVPRTSRKLGRCVEGLADNEVPPAWGSVLRAVTFSTGSSFGAFREDIYFHTREKALIVADMAVCLDDHQLPLPINRFMANSLGVHNELGVLLPFRFYLGQDPQGAKALCDALSELDIQWVILGHGSDPVKATNGDLARVYRNYFKKRAIQ